MPNVLSPRDLVFRPDIGHKMYHHRLIALKKMYGYAVGFVSHEPPFRTHYLYVITYHVFLPLNVRSLYGTHSLHPLHVR